MRNRMLHFKNRTFRVDTLNRDVQWATEKRLQKTAPQNHLPPVQVNAKTAAHFSKLGSDQRSNAQMMMVSTGGH